MKKPLLACCLAATCLLGATAPAARAQSGTPQSPYVITTAPYTVTKPGYYILGNNLNYTGTSGNIITVNANNVTLDFNGFYIAGPNNTSSGVYGVRAGERSNLTIKNGTVAYCFEGIYLAGNGNTNTNAVGAVVDNLRVTYCFFVGIEVDYSPASRITNCQVSQTGYSGASYAVGIFCYDSGTVAQNTVSTVTATNSYGIDAGGSFARQNSVSNAKYGINRGKYQDNLTSGCTTPFSQGTDAGGNN